MPLSSSASRGSFTLLGWITKALGAFSGVMPVVELLEELMLKRAEQTLKHVLGLVIVYLGMLAGVIIMVLGAVLLVMDFTVIPRGLAFMLGGLALVLGSTLFIQLHKK